MARLNFRLEAQAASSRARAATFQTLHGEVRTPVFMPVGTQATVKSQNIHTLKQSGSQVLLANTYHLLLRPGPEVFKKMGGIHRFMSWSGSVLTDSGGFQIFSLPNARQMREEGARFRSYLDGKEILLSPELSIEMQKAIGSDIMMVLDQCVPSLSSYDEAKAAMELTHRWALRSLAARGDSPQSMFGIVQGACHPELRKLSAEFLIQHPFDGFAIGGLAVGESKAQREDFTELSAELLPKDLPRYLMGVGTPIDLLEAVHRGVDMFDCILPTALAQRGVAFTSRGKLDLRRGAYKFAEDRLDPGCLCETCENYSLSYLHHLTKTQEVLGWQLLGTHNLFFYHQLMREMREAILQDRFADYYAQNRERLQRNDDEDYPKEQPRIKKPKRPATELGEYEVVINPSGSRCILHKGSGEMMHSVNDPMVEASRIYVSQSRLAERLREDTAEPLVIWDVGLGAATNAMAAIVEFEKERERGVTRRMKIVSFERDLDPLRLACRFASWFPQMKHPAPHLLLEYGNWKSPCGGIEWQLVEGDFQRCFPNTDAPDIIYYDPFSYKTNGTLWQVECFKKVFEKCRSKACELFTYSGSTAVRSSLLVAGFHVAQGLGSGPKEETTIAVTPKALKALPSRQLLGEKWLQRWQRSASRLPDLDPYIFKHPQFIEKLGFSTTQPH